MLSTDNFLREVYKEMLRITKNNVTKRLFHDREGSLYDVIIEMKEEGYNETEIAEALMHIS